MKVYVASSWKNPHQAEVVVVLRKAGNLVYDFKNPKEGNHGFSWKQVFNDPPPWSALMTRAVLQEGISEDAFQLDSGAMEWADAIVMVQPCGRSAALELGWGTGTFGKITVAYLADAQEPELMLKLADHICISLHEVVEVLRGAPRVRRGLYQHYRGDHYFVVGVGVLDHDGHGNPNAPRQVIYESTRSVKSSLINLRSEEDFTKEVEWPDGVMRSRFVRVE